MTAAPAPGPDGSAPEPPDWLAQTDLPIAVLSAGTRLYRVHRKTHDPVFFGPGKGSLPANRFDSALGRFGVLYIAPALDAALIETLLRNPERLMIDFSEIVSRAASVLTSSRDLRLVSALGANLSRMGTTAALATGPYGPCARWSDALYDHRDAPDGILYSSRHDPDQLCIALFKRPDVEFKVAETKDLTRMLSAVAGVLDGHGKSLASLP